MSDERGRGPRIELLLVIVVVAAGAFAWISRGNPVPPETPPTSAATVPPPSGWTAHESPQRRRIELPPEAAERARVLCVTMAQSQIGFALHESVVAELSDDYAVGDPETGAGDSIIMEGVARRPSGKLSDFRCSMANLGAYAGSPYVTHRERP